MSRLRTDVGVGGNRETAPGVYNTLVRHASPRSSRRQTRRTDRTIPFGVVVRRFEFSRDAVFRIELPLSSDNRLGKRPTRKYTVNVRITDSPADDDRR